MTDPGPFDPLALLHNFYENVYLCTIFFQSEPCCRILHSLRVGDRAEEWYREIFLYGRAGQKYVYDRKLIQRKVLNLFDVVVTFATYW